MTGTQQTTKGDLVALRPQEHALHGVARADDGALSAAADLSNVIPFARARRTGAEPGTPPVIVTPGDRPAPPPLDTGRLRQLALVAASVIVHGGLFYLLWQEPRELASIGVETIEVEIMVGDNRPAGTNPTPGENEVQPATPTEEVKAEETPVEQEPQKVAEVKDVAAEETQAESAKEETVEQPKEQPPEERQEIAMVQTPQAVTPTALPRETPPDMTASIVPLREQPKEVRPIVEPKAKQPAPKQADQKKEQKQAARPTPSAPADAASGRGKASMPSDPNYNGRVSAHLARYKQYPAAARSVGAHGRGMVTFSISSSGSVTSASVASGTGNGALDQELTAMVRRASPFPAPPDGRPRSFTVPVSFNFQ